MQTQNEITYKDIVFRRYPNSKNAAHRNYYRPHAGHIRAGVGHLHQEIWKDAHGPIPEGHQIHHRDGNPLNNSLDNLECLSDDEHKRRHTEMGTWSNSAAVKAHMDRVRPLTKEWHASAEGHAWHVEHGKKAWEERKPQVYTCAFCGKEFESLVCGNVYGRGVKFCSRLCSERNRSASGRRLKEKQCPVCGKTFLGQPRQKTCSRECGQRARSDRQGGGL